MTKRLSAKLAFALLSLVPPSLAAAQPALPRCRPAHELRTPMPVWTPKVIDGKLSSAPPRGEGRIVYFHFNTDDNFAGCIEPPEDNLYVFEFLDGKHGPGVRGLKVNIYDRSKAVGGGACFLSGFYVNKPANQTHDAWIETTFRPVDKFEIMSSGRYCLGDERSASDAEPRDSLPACKRLGEDRTPVPLWQPKLTRGENLSSKPPMGDGKFVYISIVRAEDCPGPWQDQPTYFTLANDDKDPHDSGGLEVAVIGNVRSQNGHCVWSGIYMNEPVTGMHQGWWSTTFRAVDAAKVISSGQFCQAQHDVAAHHDADK
jgi:hypothetical protein